MDTPKVCPICKQRARHVVPSGIRPYCKPCQAAYEREAYQADKRPKTKFRNTTKSK